VIKTRDQFTIFALRAMVGSNTNLRLMHNCLQVFHMVVVAYTDFLFRRSPRPKKQQKSAPRGSLSLDKRGPHTGYASSAVNGLRRTKPSMA
jgi:hypothetical protein